MSFHLPSQNAGSHFLHPLQLGLPQSHTYHRIGRGDPGSRCHAKSILVHDRLAPVSFPEVMLVQEPTGGWPRCVHHSSPAGRQGDMLLLLVLSLFRRVCTMEYP